MTSKISKTFVTNISPEVASKLQADLPDQGFDLDRPPHTIFSAKKKGVSCTLYESGKLVVQGKEMNDFIEFYLEPEILKSFEFTHQEPEGLDSTGRMGIDESGKGDFFGPLCIAGVFAEGKGILELKSLGVKDSKKMSDPAISKLAEKIRANYAYHIVKINPQKYNELIQKFGNLNHLLAWGHATVIEHLAMKTSCSKVIIDQFANENVVLTALKRKSLVLDVVQRTKGEEDLVVAAASILARDTFVRGLEELSKEFGMQLNKGASSLTIQTGKEFVKQFGKDKLPFVAKTHFKTYQAVVQQL